MLENKFFHLLITIVWMSGLLGIILTLAHALLERRKYQRYGASPWTMPRILVSLYASIATFCVGLALHAYAAQQSISLWISIVWWGLAILFVWRLVTTLSLGVQQGWGVTHTSQHVIGIDHASSKNSWTLVGSGITLVLLLVNAALLGWWGSTQIQAGRLNLAQGISPGTATVDKAPVSLPTVVLRSTQEQQKSPEQLLDMTVTVTPPSLSIISVSITSVASMTTVSPVRTTPSPPPVLLPTPTPSVAVEAKSSLMVRSAAGANVRAAPSLDGDILTTLADGTLVPVLGRTADSQWFLIRLDEDTSGWISMLVIELGVAGDEISVIEMN